MVLAADNMADPLVCIINHDRKMKERALYATRNDKVMQFGCVKSDGATDGVGKGQLGIRITEPDDPLFSNIRAFRRDQLFEHLRVPNSMSALMEDFIRLEPQPLQGLQNILLVLFFGALLVGVFNAYDKCATALFSKKVGKNRRAVIARVQ